MIDLPHDRQTEAAVLGACMLDDEAAHLCRESRVVTDHFIDPIHRKTWQVIQKLIDDQRFPDMVLVSERGIDYKELERMGDACVTPKHLGDYLATLTDLYLRRACMAKAHEVLERCADAEKAEELRSWAEHGFAAMAPEAEVRQDTAAALDAQMTRWKQAKTTHCLGLTTGNPSLDSYLGGLLPGALYIFSGEPGAGKTTLARNVCEHLARHGEPVAFASLEQTREFMLGAVMATEAKQSVYKLNYGSPSVDWDAIERAKDKIKDWPLLIDDRQHTLTSLTSWARRMVGRHKCKLLVIDYLQRISPEQRYDSDERRISDYSLTVTTLAKNLRVPIICISSLSRDGRLRGSGQLDYDAWAHIKMTKSEQQPMNGDVAIDVHYEKQRTGPPCDSEQWLLLGDRQKVVCRREQP